MKGTADSAGRPLPAGRFVALCGGIGGAKLALGLAELLGERLTVIVNTGDDFEHLGLHVSPDVDTAVYTLAGVADPDKGWGRRDETWSFMAAIERLGGPAWFRLGDADLAVHVERTRRLRAGETLSAVTGHLAEAFGIAARIAPMSDEPVRTMLDTDAGTLAFQEYFVRDRCAPAVRGIRFEGAAAARPAPAVAAALADPDLRGIVVCPSNPWLSIDPIRAVPGLEAGLRAAGVPIVAVTPIIAGRAVKGPAAKIMAELGLEQSAVAVAEHYAGLVDGFVLDETDGALAGRIGAVTLPTRTLMLTHADKIALARECLGFCARLGEPRRQPAPAARRAGARP